MSGRPGPALARRLATLAAVGVVAVGLAVALGPALRDRMPRPAAPAGGALPDTGSDAAIDAALRLAPVDSVALKQRWQDEVRGLEYADLDVARREVFLRFANAERCTCGCGYTLAGCLASDMTCDVSRPRAQALLDSVRAGLVRDARGVRERPAAAPR